MATLMSSYTFLVDMFCFSAITFADKVLSAIYISHTTSYRLISTSRFGAFPFYYSPHVSFYQPLYSDDFVFEELTIKFSVSTSANYEKAVFICRRMPNYKLSLSENGSHSFTINTYLDFYIHQRAIQILMYLIYSWKSTMIFINKELVTERDLRDMSWILTQRLKHCPYPLPPYVEYDVAQEYWDIYKKPIISKPKRRKPNGKSKK